MRGPTDYFINAYGLFSDVWAPIAESAISISVAILCGMKWGLPGVLMGDLTASILIIYVWKTYFLFTRGFKVNPLRYWLLWVKTIWPMILGAVAAYFVAEYFGSILTISNPWIEFGYKAVIYTIIIFTISSIILWGISLHFRVFFKRLLSTVLKRGKRFQQNPK